MRKKVIVIFLIIIILVVFCYCGHAFLKNNDEYDVDETIIKEDAVKSDDEIDIKKKISELRENVNNEIVGWLEIEGTQISYPVLQNEDNNYYINHNYKGEESNNGAIFLDKDVDLELPSSNFLIYGHNNLDSSGDFAPLMNYKSEEFYNAHKKINFITEKEEMKFEIISIFYSKVYYKNQKDVFRYYYFTNANNEEEFYEYVNNSKAVSIFDIDTTAQYGEQLLTLSTCEYSQENGRFVIVAKKINI